MDRTFQTRPVVFFDLDFTLYDTDVLIAGIAGKLLAMGHAKEEIDQQVLAMNEFGFSFTRLLGAMGHSQALSEALTPEFEQLLASGNKLLLDGAVEAVGRVSEIADCVLLTYGYPPYQIEKYRHLTQLHDLMTECHFVWRGTSKGNVVRGYGPNRAKAFYDDGPPHLADVKNHDPATLCVRAMWPQFCMKPHPEDGNLWQTATSASLFADMICGSWPPA